MAKNICITKRVLILFKINFLRAYRCGEYGIVGVALCRSRQIHNIIYEMWSVANAGVLRELKGSMECREGGAGATHTVRDRFQAIDGRRLVSTCEHLKSWATLSKRPTSSSRRPRRSWTAPMASWDSSLGKPQPDTCGPPLPPVFDRRGPTVCLGVTLFSHTLTQPNQYWPSFVRSLAQSAPAKTFNLDFCF